MLYKVTSIEFDFDSDEIPTQNEQQELIESTLATVWEADDEDDLLDEISTATGWCILSLEYVHALV